MPHIHLETTADLVENAHVPDMLEALAVRLASYETIDPKAVKAYHTLRSNWVMGEGAPAGFAHCTVMIMTGRPLELRKKIADEMFAEMKGLFTESAEANEVSLTFELREMAAETYRK